MPLDHLARWLMNRRPTKAYRHEGRVLFYRAYLYRIGPWVLYLHRYMRPDPDRGMHDHPASALVVILSGGYMEQRLAGFSSRGIEKAYRYRRPGSVFRIRPTDFHRVGSLLNGESWSFFLARYVDKQWGFLEDLFVNHDQLNRPQILNLRYYLAGGGLDEEWWRTARPGREVMA